MGVVVGALQLKKGAKVDSYQQSLGLTQPAQFISKKDKDDYWVQSCINWYELQGIKQIKLNAKRFMKNIKLANGIIDKSDYIIEDDNEMSDIIDNITKEDVSALDLKFYPIIPNVINVLTGEFNKRVSKLQFVAIDDISRNEMMEQKRQMLEDTLVKQAEQKMIQQMVEQGQDPNDPQLQQQLSPENIKSLPEIEDFFKKSYRSMLEEWATHQLNVDSERFHLQELEERQFKNSLILDREFWHFKMNEDDYEIEEWNPLFTFYHKSPDVRYISQGNFVGKIDLVSVADVIDRYGYLMTEEQLKSLEKLYPIKGVGYGLSGTPNDGSMYDPTQSYQSNVNIPSVGFRQLTAFADNWTTNGDIIQWLMSEDEQYLSYGNTQLIRVSTVYWKTQRKLFHLTRITDEGELVQDVVDENYKVTTKPMYDTTFITNKSKDNLVYGEHLDAIWINEVWGGVKIGPNRPVTWANQSSEINPMFLGINQANPGRLPFQFKGDYSLYGCKLPVEGTIFSDRNIRSTSLVDQMKPFQVAYNLVNNQIADILVDELGTVILLDQNALPKESLGETWGRNNYAKAYVAMKDFGILPLDTSMQNTEGSMQFNQYTTLDLEQSKRLMGRVELAKYFKEAALEVVGITPQRLGNIQASESATGTTQAVNNSYAQTEKYFTQHSDYLMPRVHQMRTDLAMFYHSNKSSIRLQYLTSTDERVNFEMEGTKLLLRDLNVFCTTKVNYRELLQQMKQLALHNNTIGASLYDIGSVLKADSIAELDRVLKAAEDKQQAQVQSQQQHEQELQQQQEQAAQQAQQAQQQFEANENEKDRQARILEAEIKSAGYPDTTDNGHDEYMDRLGVIQKQDQFRETMDQKRTSESNKMTLEQKKIDLQHQKIAAERDRSNKQLQVARVNNSKPKPKS
jgi:hypothetical protein